MKKNLLWSAIIFIAMLAACSPAQSVSGTYNGSLSSSGNLTSGSGTLKVTENGQNNVNMVLSSSGNPDVSINNVSVTRISVLSVTYYDLNLSTSFFSLSGTMYENARTIDISYSDSDSTDYDFSFSGTK